MTILMIVFIGSGMAGFFMGWRFTMPKKQGGRNTLSCVSSLAFLFLTGGSYGYWYYHRPRPSPISQEAIFQGVTYTRNSTQSPRPNVVHIVTIDLKTPGIGFLVTPSPSTGNHQFPARTTSQFLQEFGVQVAINGSFFFPFHAKIFSYYPHVGDPVSVYGLAMSQGQQYALPQLGYNTLYISRHNEVSIGHPIAQPYHAISGSWIFVKEGQVQYDLNDPYDTGKPQPRTAVAIDQTGQHLMILVIDGRQPNYSEGMTLVELGELAVTYGAYTALNLDNGGSSTLVIEDQTGKPVVLNCPIHRRISPGRERPVANHLGIFAHRIS